MQCLCRTGGSRKSVVLDLGMGLIIILPHSDGTMPELKQTLNRICRKETQTSFFNTSTGIESLPHALPHFALVMAFHTSDREIF